MSTPGHTSVLQALLALGGELNAATMEYQQTLAARLGVNLTDYGCLQLLAAGGPRTAGELAARLGLSPGAVTGVIDRLERAGFVRRVRDAADRRRVIVETVPEEVERRMAPLFRSVYQALADKVGRYSEAELRIVLGYLETSLAAVREETARLRDDPPAG